MQSEGLFYMSMVTSPAAMMRGIPRSFTCIVLPFCNPVLATVVFLSLGTGLPSSALVMRMRCTETPVAFEMRS